MKENEDEMYWCKCDNCTWQGELIGDLVLIPDLLSRLEPGGQVPAGECPKCGALAYPVPEPTVNETKTGSQNV